MSAPIVLESLDLAALLCSRVCHDLISPVGAIVNGLEVLEEEKDEETKTFALDLIKLAFGAAGSAGVQIDVGDAETMARGFIEDDKTKLAWNLPRVLLAKNRVKLLLNMLIIAGQGIPRGGVLTVDPVGEGESMSFRITAAGPNGRVPPHAVALLAGTPEGNVDAHAIQPFYTGMLARSCGLGVSVAAENDTIVVAAA